MNTTQLSERQRGILRAMFEYIAETGIPPTLREIAVLCKMSSTSIVRYHLHEMMRYGTLKQIDGHSRSIVPTSIASTVSSSRDSVARAGRRGLAVLDAEVIR